MIKYKVSALRKKTVFEKCEFIIESESKDEARYEAADILDDCRNGEGRKIGYAYKATCDYKGCNKKIDRGLYYVCGTMHGEDEDSCGGYFCDKHSNNAVENIYDETIWVCDECYKFHLEYR